VPRLGAFGLQPDQADDIAAGAARSSSMQGNPVALSPGDLRTVLLRSI
jgi:alcohol dehydrogenase class IV